jgi:hypothetical protein
MTRENLIHLFLERLEEDHLPTETAAELIHKVTREYMLIVLEKSLIPLEFFEDVFEEIESEVLELYRKKTYGFLTLPEYRAFQTKDFSKTEK